MKKEPMNFLLGSEHECDYLPGRLARSAFLISNPDRALSDYRFLIKQGFRRSGDLIYRPYCRECKACIPVRIPVEQFCPSRGQRRIWNKNADLCVERKPPVFNQRHFDLYRRYLNARHTGGTMCESSPEEYIQFLATDWAETGFYEFKLDDRIIAVAVVDHLHDALSAVYTFFDPELAHRSLGGYAILWEINETRKLGLPFLYLGYWIQACRKMTYKKQYRPLEGQFANDWQPIKEQ